jgi:hypothetical protein
MYRRSPTRGGGTRLRATDVPSGTPAQPSHVVCCVCSKHRVRSNLRRARRTTFPQVYVNTNTANHEAAAEPTHRACTGGPGPVQQRGGASQVRGRRGDDGPHHRILVRSAPSRTIRAAFHGWRTANAAISRLWAWRRTTPRSRGPKVVRRTRPRPPAMRMRSRSLQKPINTEPCKGGDDALRILWAEPTPMWVLRLPELRLFRQRLQPLI